MLLLLPPQKSTKQAQAKELTSNKQMPLEVRNILDQDCSTGCSNRRVYRQDNQKVATKKHQKADDVNIILNYGKLKKLMKKNLACKKKWQERVR